MIPFNKPYYSTTELEFAQDAIQRGKINGDGYYTKKVCEYIETLFSTKKALLTTSCSSALDMAAILLDLHEGDEVILPSYTFTSTANAVVLRGAKPVFADIDEYTLNIDPLDIERKLTSRTKAVFVVHYAGISCNMDLVMSIANKHNLKVVEDAAQAVNAKFKDKFLGTIGDIGCYSFHETKNYSCGEGGAILINQDNQLIQRAEIIREKGTNRSKFFRGEVDKYTWVDVGSSYLPSDILAAMLYAQFEKLEEINLKRRQAFEYYYKKLITLEKKGILKLPYIPEYSSSNYHAFFMILNSETDRDSLMGNLKANGITALYHYVPLHLSPMGNKLGYRIGELPITEDLSTRLLRLPMYAGITIEDQEYITDKIIEFF